MQRRPWASPMASWRRRALASAAGVPLALAAVLALGGCGGGLFVSFGDDDLWGAPPTVSLVASVSSAVPGQTVRLAAAASAERGIDQVLFMRLEDDGGTTPLGADAQAPYEWDAVVPAGARVRVRFIARATDRIGQRTDSAPVTLTLP